MTNFLRFFTPATFAGCLFSCSAPDDKQPTVGSLDTARYSGEWHEIARLPNPFEKNLVAAKATYQATPDGKITVRNDGLKEDGTRTSITGTARQPKPTDPGKLLVRFEKFPANLIDGDYWILDVNPAYSRALVGSPNKDFLWLLSKNPSDGSKEFAPYIRQAKLLGYNTENLFFNPKRITY